MMIELCSGFDACDEQDNIVIVLIISTWSRPSNSELNLVAFESQNQQPDRSEQYL